MKKSPGRLAAPFAIVLLAGPAQAVQLGEVPFTAVTLPLGAGGEYAVAADVNGDGHPDLLATRRDAGELACYMNDGRGGFDRPQRGPAGQQPVGLAAADFDGDGRLDLAVANHETDHLGLLLGDGRCGFRPAPDSPLRLRVRPHVHAVQAADFNGDGQVDLVVDARESEGLMILPNRGGRFVTDGPMVRMGGDPYRGMAVGDLDGDGNPDMVTPNPRDIGIALGTPSADFAFQVQRPLAADTPFGVALGDVNGDGRVDIVSASGQDSDAVQVFLGRGRAGFEEHPDSPFDFATGAKAVATGDFDADGRADAVVAGWSSEDVLVLMGGQRALTPVRLPGGAHPWGLAVADFNGDRYDDLAIVDQGGDGIRLYLSGDARGARGARRP